MQLRWYQQEAVDSVFSTEFNNPHISLPTGVGKSVVGAYCAYRQVQAYPAYRVLILTHSRKLVAQNHATFTRTFPGIVAGIYSAGLRKKQFDGCSVIFAGIQSIANIRPGRLSSISMIIIDEAHRVSEDEKSTYQKFFSSVKALNPAVRIVGMSATPWRMKSGWIFGKGKTFDGESYSAITPAAFCRMVDEGFLCPVVAPSIGDEMRIDTSKIEVSSSGEFVAESSGDVVLEALDSIFDWLVDTTRRHNKTIIFTPSIKCADVLNERLVRAGVRSAVTHSKVETEEQDAAVDGFSGEEYDVLVNPFILTTGFDNPRIDAMIDLQATNSSSLHVQKGGRLTRPHESKKFATWYDLCGNIERLGPINDPVIFKPSKGGKAPTKTCPECGLMTSAASKFCSCGFEFPFMDGEEAESNFSFSLKFADPVKWVRLWEQTDFSRLAIRPPLSHIARQTDVPAGPFRTERRVDVGFGRDYAGIDLRLYPKTLPEGFTDAYGNPITPDNLTADYIQKNGFRSGFLWYSVHESGWPRYNSRIKSAPGPGDIFWYPRINERALQNTVSFLNGDEPHGASLTGVHPQCAKIPVPVIREQLTMLKAQFEKHGLSKDASSLKKKLAEWYGNVTDSDEKVDDNGNLATRKAN